VSGASPRINCRAIRNNFDPGAGDASRIWYGLSNGAQDLYAAATWSHTFPPSVPIFGSRSAARRTLPSKLVLRAIMRSSRSPISLPAAILYALASSVSTGSAAARCASLSAENVVSN